MPTQRKSLRRVSSVRNSAKDRELEKLLLLASQYYKPRPVPVSAAAKTPARKGIRVA